MEELNDKDFDQIFKNKIASGYPEYEEGSWIKMEKKLRRRDRFVFYRNASVILLFLSFGLGMYLISGENSVNKEVKTVKAVKKAPSNEIEKIDDLVKGNEALAKDGQKATFTASERKTTTNALSKNELFIVKPEVITKSVVSTVSQNQLIDSSVAIVQNVNAAQNTQTNLAPESKNQTLIETLIDEKIHLPRNAKAKRPIALSILVGPDFSSTENAIGGKRGIAIGLGVNIPISKKLSVQTGLNYGTKNYDAKAYDYTFNNPNTVNTIAGIDASCKVIEIPLRASYNLLDNQKNSINLNAGLSSYLMLKENYRFIYTAASGRKDRFLEEKNANQHYLSIIDLSATYNIKLKNKKFALGLEPYVKIPLNGIGAGRVPLKSSGISLKLNYELNK